MCFTYSPLPIEDYTAHSACIKQIQELDSRWRVAAWNFFWMSNPDLDGTATVTGTLRAIIDDIQGDEVLCRKLTAHPAAFLRWFTDEDQSIFDTFNAYGRYRWVTAVKARAEDAAKRLERRRTERMIA